MSSSCFILNPAAAPVEEKECRDDDIRDHNARERSDFLDKLGSNCGWPLNAAKPLLIV